ncbi:hypothetical protein [Tsuneonella amylolytica]|uniref:hypothetical protein n=1 Tax=Tsuneonella amylolytica TaxID=2338327 RepID=UPI000EA8EBFE|nr:hypothetical protein [Tsuneonella amylolytica]
MTILTALLLMGAQGAAAPQAIDPSTIDPKVAEQVPIIAGKLQDWRGAWGAVDGKLGCKTVKSTGDAEIDVIGCAALIECVGPAYPALKTIADGADTADVKKRKIGEKLATLNPCLKEKRGLGIAQLALKRGASARKDGA